VLAERLGEYAGSDLIGKSAKVVDDGVVGEKTLCSGEDVRAGVNIFSVCRCCWTCLTYSRTSFKGAHIIALHASTSSSVGSGVCLSTVSRWAIHDGSKTHLMVVLRR